MSINLLTIYQPLDMITYNHPAKERIMSEVIKMELAKAAKKSGGDKYMSDDEQLTIYFPQSISRPDGEPVDQITITVEV
jgi:hypothetical protein